MENPEQLSFHELEASMYRRRRRNQPALPLAVSDVNGAISGSCYSLLRGGVFYRGEYSTGIK